ncbi:hypothetical protein SAMN05421680_102301 [Xenorhabdus mauleonii]|uniref:Uncharacterized protein n=1 Tax=Xenorhabdus mauleonii TaxID=351675 RepID=A0A1I3JRU3_9GAMM|nr:hypothetical protein SAMN05421680_102301 [Xenorhabdus mauleonii]
MIFVLLKAINFVVFFLLFSVVSYFFILDRKLKKTIVSSLLVSIVFILVEISSPILLYCFLYLSELFYNVVH